MLSLAAPTSGVLAATTSIPRCFDVVIIGAGAAGLECALSLRAARPMWKIAILEARNRVGGRIHTTYCESGLVDGDGTTKRFPYDEGAGWIHGIHPDADGLSNPMLDYIKDQSDYVEVAPGNPWMRPRSILHGKDCVYLYHDGQAVTNEQFEPALAEHERRMKQVEQSARDMICAGNGIEASQSSLARALPSTCNVLATFYLHLHSVWNGCEAPETLQLISFADEYNNNGDGDDHFKSEGDFPGPHCVLRSGLGGIITCMIDRHNLAETIQLEHVVTRISTTDLSNNEADLYPVTVETAKNGNFQAKACVVTLPIGCIQAKLKEGIFFGSPLSGPKIEACSYMEQGTYKKVFLTFRLIHWPADRPFLGLVVSTPHPILGHCLFLDNLWASKNIPCLEAILVGASAEWATGKSDELIRDTVLDFLKAALPHCSDDEQDVESRWTVVSTHVTRWEEDPYSLGAYSHMTLGGLPRHTDALQTSEWDDRLFFAGEATVTGYEGSVHAALLSGRRTAMQLLDSSWLTKEFPQQPGVAA
jgi:monoamine oxidase